MTHTDDTPPGHVAERPTDGRAARGALYRPGAGCARRGWWVLAAWLPAPTAPLLAGRAWGGAYDDPCPDTADAAFSDPRAADVAVEYGGQLGRLADPEHGSRSSEAVGPGTALVVPLVGFGRWPPPFLYRALPHWDPEGPGKPPPAEADTAPRAMAGGGVR